MQDVYKIKNLNEIDSPALIVYPAIIAENIRKTVEIAGGVKNLRPHVKTNKISEVCHIMLQAGIAKFKCATVAEAEMLAMLDVPDVLLAYQPVGPKITRLLNLVEAYPQTSFSCLLDNISNATLLQQACKEKDHVMRIYIDLNVGMNRTGIYPDKAIDLINHIRSLSHLQLAGIHGYDGHIHNENLEDRTIAANQSYNLVSSSTKLV